MFKNTLVCVIGYCLATRRVQARIVTDILNKMSTGKCSQELVMLGSTYTFEILHHRS